MIDPQVALDRLDQALAAGSVRARNMPRTALNWVSWAASFVALVGVIMLREGQLLGLGIVASVFGAAFVAGYPFRRRNRRRAAAVRRVLEAVREHPEDIVEIAYHTRGEYGPKGYGLLVLVWIVLRDGTAAPLRLVPDELDKVLAQLQERCPAAIVHTGEPMESPAPRPGLVGRAVAGWLERRRHDALAAPAPSTPGATSGVVEPREEK